MAPDYCVETTDTNLACLSKKVSGQGSWYDDHYCKIASHGTDCVTCIANPSENCQQPGQGGSSNPGFENMEEEM
jgi:hypothetical protein